MNITINYPFEELNNATILNCDIYLRKKKYPNHKISIICPSTFKDIFQSADNIYEIKNNILKNFKVKNFKTVLEYVKPDKRLISYSTRLKNFLSSKYKSIYILLDAVINKKLKIILFQNFYNTGRLQKFWLDNKLKDYCLKRFKIGNYFHINTNIDLVNMQTNLFYNSWYNQKFERLKEKINDGVFLEIKNKNKLCIECLKILSKINNKTIIFRTRNMKNKQINSNSNSLFFLNIIKKLLEKNIRIIQLGFPEALRFKLKDKNYFEYDNNLSFGDEYYLLNRAKAVFTTTQNNNFITLSNCKLNLITYDQEPHLFYKKPISLLESRKKFFNDIDISEEILNKKIDLAIDKILLQFSV